jgi:membrane protease YdiL (CAAX protease family)
VVLKPTIAIGESTQLASGWHTVILVTYLLFPFSLTPIPSLLMRLANGNERPWIYVTGFLWQAIAIAIMTLGLRAKLSFMVLLGEKWRIGRDGEIGVYSCFIFLGIGVALYFVLGPFDRISRRTLPTTLVELLGFLPFAIFASFSEELVFRGYLLNQIRAIAQSKTAALFIQAALFVLIHGYTQTIAGVLDKFFLGFLLGILVLWRKNLFPGIVAHVLLNISAGVLSVIIA